MSLALKHISTYRLIDLAEYVVSQPFDEGMDVLLDEILSLLLDRLPLSAYHRLVHPIETTRKVHA